MEAIKTVALVAHDNRKQDLIEWIEWNYHTLLEHEIVCTGTTGKLVEEAIKTKLKGEGKSSVKVDIVKLRSGPLGGD